MDLWQILVLALLRVNCNSDWDRIQNLANNHMEIRQMMGLGTWLDPTRFSLQAIKDNAALLKPETLEKISSIVVGEGHKLVKKKEEGDLRGRCDSAVVETNVHYPTDINVLLDAIRKVLFLLAALCVKAGFPGLRKVRYNFNQAKKLYRKCQKIKHSTSKDDARKQEQKDMIVEAHQAYLALVSLYLDNAKRTIAEILSASSDFTLEILEIETYIMHAERQIDQIQRRIVNGETIPHDEKVFSVFEEHTEWICKGKAGVPFQLGIRVCILEDQYGFILNNRVMEKETDVDVAVPMVKEALIRFPELSGTSFDKGFWSPDNKKELDEILDYLVLPKKGKLSAKDKEREYSEEFIYYRNRHSAVESGINALQNHGLDQCPDHGIHGFRRYVSIAVLGRNIQKLGAVLQVKERKKRKRKKNADNGGAMKNAA